MLALLIELVGAPLLAGAATVTARSWGPRAGGVVSAFPAIVGPVLLITALGHGSAFAARTANGTLLGLVSLSAFAVGYACGATRWRWRWPACLGVGWACAAGAALVVGTAADGAGAPTGLAVATLSLAVAYRAIPAGSAANDPETGAHAIDAEPGPTPINAGSRPTPINAGSGPAPINAASGPAPIDAEPGPAPLVGDLAHDLWTRMALTALLVFSLAAAAATLGPLVGGMLTALPVLASLLAVFAHRQYGGREATALLRGTVAGMAGFVAFVEAVALLVVPGGIAAAFAGATVVALIVQALTVRPPGRGRPGRPPRRHDAERLGELAGA